MTSTATPPPAEPAPAAPDLPRPHVVRAGPLALQWQPRPLLVAVGAAAVVAVMFIAALMFGEEYLAPDRLIAVLRGHGTHGERVLLLDWRANRALAAALSGAALGVAGALMQTVTRNPLASPDILGITAGASMGVVTVIALTDGQISAEFPWALPLAALAGGLVIAAAIALVSFGLDPLRMVLGGIALAALCTAGVTYALTVVPSDVATTAFAWLAGSLNQRGPEHLAPVAVALGVAVPLVAVASRATGLLSLGPVRAGALGVRVTMLERLMLLMSVVLATAAVAAVGPIGFIAFVSPQIARALARTPAPPPFTSGLIGATLVLGADLLIRGVLSWNPPIGAVTSALGAPVLIFFLWRATHD